MTRSYWREHRAGERIEDAQEKLYDEHPDLRPVSEQTDSPQEEDAKAPTRGEAVRNALVNLVAAALAPKGQ